MRRLFSISIALLLAGLACQLPNLGDIQGTVGGVQQTIVAGITEIPATVEAAATEISAPTETPSATSGAAATGTIRGHLIYPSEVLVAQRIVAFDTATMAKVAEVTTVQGQNQYELTVPAGNYFVVAYTLDGKLSAGYSQAVPCGLLNTCMDHSLIPVHVGSGAVVENIDPTDWYAPEGTFPPMP